MSLNSVNTNMGAMVALQSLNTTETQLTATQKQISTGYRVAGASDDGAAYSIAQGIRSTVGSLTTANQQLGNAQGLLSTTTSALNNISTTMASMRNVLVNLASSSVSGDTRTEYENQYKSMLANVQSYIQDASYEGKTLIGNIASSSGTFGTSAITRNESGSLYTIGTVSGSSLYGSIGKAATLTSLGSATFVQALLTTGGTFLHAQAFVGEALNTLGNSTNYVNNQITYNNDKIDALNTGLGSLVDADLAKESAQLTALQKRQQLGTQALSLANQAPQTLLSLFK
jgi:flagellin